MTWAALPRCQCMVAVSNEFDLNDVCETSKKILSNSSLGYRELHYFSSKIPIQYDVDDSFLSIACDKLNVKISRCARISLSNP